jgi:hypothetical protein
MLGVLRRVYKHFFTPFGRAAPPRGGAAATGMFCAQTG